MLSTFFQWLAGMKKHPRSKHQKISKYRYNQMLLDARAARKARLAKLTAETGVDWSSVITLPAFQMFLQERRGITLYDNSEPLDDDLNDSFILELSGESAAALFDEYDHWHAAKGYWPNETPTGQLIDDLRELTTLSGGKA